MSRRANGEGTIYRRKDGRYEGAAYVLTTRGQRKRLRVYGTTRAEAHSKLTAAIHQSEQGMPVVENSWRMAEYLDHWLETVVRTKRRALTHRRHESIVRLHLKPGLGRYTLRRLSVQIVQNFIDSLYAAGQSEASLYQIRKVLSASLKSAVQQELLLRNVARLVELPRYKPAEAQHWTIEEARRFLEAARTDPLYPAFVLLLLYGLRRGEVLGLRWCDIDHHNGILRIRQQLQRIGGELRQVDLKTDSSHRDEPLLATAQLVLANQLARQAAARQTTGRAWQGSGDENELVFTTRSGRPLESRNLYRSFLRICDARGLRRITLHGLRHTNATAQKNLRIHARDIQAILGHADVRTTGIYEHVNMENKRVALEKVDRHVFGDKDKDDGNSRCRHLLPSSHLTGVLRTSFYFGGSSQTRTGDTRLFKATDDSVQTRIIRARDALDARMKRWTLGAVAVNLAVRIPGCTHTNSDKSSSGKSTLAAVPIE
jgi:integrase